MHLKNDTITALTILFVHSIGGILAIMVELVCNRTIDRYSVFVYLTLGWAAFFIVCMTDTFYDKVEEASHRLHIEFEDFRYYTTRSINRFMCGLLTGHNYSTKLTNADICEYCGHVKFKKNDFTDLKGNME